jgi:hypothetical protein
MNRVAGSFDTAAEARAFVDGVNFVNDSAISDIAIENQAEDRDYPLKGDKAWVVLVQDDDHVEDDAGAENA